MHKSIFTFGVLITSLVMLAVMPLLNNNNFSNTVMAQGYNDNYYGDKYYSKYPADDKKYECRTSAFEGFLCLQWSSVNKLSLRIIKKIEMVK
jgi:hypothetical protein